MKVSGHTQEGEVAVRHRATSAQPPRATSLFPLWSFSQHASHPFPSTVALDTPGALLEGLRCFPAAYPLPLRLEGPEGNGEGFSRASK
jgi:hypothetical protein